MPRTHFSGERRSLGEKRRQRGITLMESLVAFAVVSLGSVSVIRLQRDLHFNADLSTERAEASHLAQASLERRRAGAGIDAAVTGASSATAESPNTRFTITDTSAPLDSAAPNSGISARVSVSWPDTAGASREVSLDSVVGSVNPALSAALSLRAIDAFPSRIEGRAASIPAEAVNLGNGQSAWMPNPATRVVWLFDNLSGRVITRCIGTSSATPEPASASAPGFSASDLSNCSAAKAGVLSGVVRTSLTSPPDATDANDTPGDVSVMLSLTVPAQAQPPSCTAQAQRSVEAVYGSGAGAVLRRQAVPLDATPASVGAARWTDLHDRFIAYRCVVALPGGGWTGRATVVPAPPLATVGFTPPTTWTIGTSTADRRVCRYVPEPTSASSDDPNMMHPAEYVAVTGSLAQQNFLIIRGDQQCPQASGDSRISTAQVQP